VPSLEPSSAITMRSGRSVWASRAASVTGSTAASLCEATITPRESRRAAAAGEGAGRGRRIGSVIHATNSSSTVSYST